MNNKYIKKEDVKQALLDKSFYPAIVQSVIEHIPIYDVVEVIRCKDCCHWNNWFSVGKKGSNNYQCVCNVWSDDGCRAYTKIDDFCSYGKRG